MLVIIKRELSGKMYDAFAPIERIYNTETLKCIVASLRNEGKKLPQQFL
jgi:hypothetical protein